MVRGSLALRRRRRGACVAISGCRELVPEIDSIELSLEEIDSDTRHLEKIEAGSMNATLDTLQRFGSALAGGGDLAWRSLRLGSMSEPIEVPLPIAMARAMRAADENWPRSRPAIVGGAARLERWGSLVIPGGAARANFSHAFPRIELSEQASARRVFRACDQQAGQVLVGSMGRRRLRAERVHLFGRRSMGDRPDVGASDAAGYQLIDWTIADPRRPTTVFVGALAGFEHVVGWANVRLPPVFGLGHLYVPSLREDIPDVGLICAMGGHDGVRLALRWHESGVMPDRPWLTRVIAAVSFALGVPTHVPLFVGYDDRGRRAAACGSLFGVRREFGSLPGQPISVAGPAWAVPFLRRLLVLLRDRPGVPELDLALQYYLDSYDDAPDAAYLKLVVVLEGLALRVLQERGAAVGVRCRGQRLSVVQNERDWKALAKQLGDSAEFSAWRMLVEGKRDEIAGMLMPNAGEGKDWAAGVIDKLASKSLSGADELSAGQRVMAALLALGAKPDRSMTRECREWHGARHTGVAPGERRHVEDRLVLLRSMLILLISRWAGYAGPILGHVRERDRHGRPAAIRDLPAAVFGADVDEAQREEACARYVDGRD